MWTSAKSTTSILTQQQSLLIVSQHLYPQRTGLVAMLLLSPDAMSVGPSNACQEHDEVGVFVGLFDTPAFQLLDRVIISQSTLTLMRYSGFLTRNLHLQILMKTFLLLLCYNPETAILHRRGSTELRRSYKPGFVTYVRHLLLVRMVLMTSMYVCKYVCMYLSIYLSISLSIYLSIYLAS